MDGPEKPQLPTVIELEKVLLDINPRVFEGVSNTKKKTILRTLQQRVDHSVEVRSQEIIHRSQSTFSGPLPPPEMLLKYNEVDPDLANKIVQMAIDEQLFYHQKTEEEINGIKKLRGRGQIFAFTIAVSAIIGGVVCIALDQAVAGTIISGIGLTGLVKEFLKGHSTTQSSDS